MRRGRSDLFLARIRGDHPIKAPSEIHAGLAAARGAVPDGGLPGRECGKVIEQRRGITWTEIRITLRDFGEVVLKCGAHVSADHMSGVASSSELPAGSRK